MITLLTSHIHEPLSTTRMIKLLYGKNWMSSKTEVIGEVQSDRMREMHVLNNSIFSMYRNRSRQNLADLINHRMMEYEM